MPAELLSPRSRDSRRTTAGGSNVYYIPVKPRPPRLHDSRPTIDGAGLVNPEVFAELVCHPGGLCTDRISDPTSFHRISRSMWSLTVLRHILVKVASGMSSKGR